jgi:hypothetical protein
MLANQTNQVMLEVNYLEEKVKLVMTLKKEEEVITHFQYLVEVAKSFNPKKVEEVEDH